MATMWNRRQKNKRHTITPIEVQVLRTIGDYALVQYTRRHRLCGAIVATKNLSNG